jgi:hypothetical protein
MNCLKPDHPYYAITFPLPVQIGFGKSSTGPPCIHPVFPSFIEFPSFYGFVSSTYGQPVVFIKEQFRPAMESTGRRFDTRYKGLG